MKPALLYIFVSGHFFLTSTMIKKLLNDSIVSNLASKCSLTETQIDSLLVAKSDQTLEAKTALCDRGKVTKGSFIRSLRQGELNIEGSICTLFLLGYLGLISPGRFGQLARIGDMISRVKASEPNTESTRRLLEAIDEFAKEFSGRQKRKP